ncbi:Transposon Tf2-6 polyprotein [Labeo rohita]|uniref:Gypsy retrotransposon integrase-like protein 1 n=1 Tax=Labeo rohita TaxID=84645 RepID=A0ABQ8M0U8_LABRO|nr:Transposon Tf2-6 polyprotein [Labeo rohita]
MSPRRSLWLPLTAVSGNHPRTFSLTSLRTPYLGPPRRRFRFRVFRVTSLRRPFIPRSRAISERFPCIYCLLLPTGLFISFTPLAACLLDLLPGLFVYALDSPYCSRLLLFDLRLHDYVIKVSHMDPTPPPPSVSVLQNTSPTSDPAIVYPASSEATAATPPSVLQIASELSAQASTLAVHQQQLHRLTDLTEQLVRTLQGLQLTPQPAAQPAATPPSGNQSTSASPRLAFPEKFDGTAARCKGFLLQCSLFVDQQPHLYPTDEGKIAFVCSLLTGKALDWATAVWRLDRPTFPSFAAFLQQFKGVFQPSSESGEAGEEIMALRQGRRSAADYALTFRTLAAQSGWNDGPLKLHYRKGLNSDLQLELACRDEDLTLEQYIDLSIRVDNVMRARRSTRHLPSLPLSTASPEAPSEPMQLGATRLSLEERERRLRNNLCLYCGQAGHIRANCPTRPPRQPSSVSSADLPIDCCSMPVTLECGEAIIKTTALIDSGAAGNFIDADFVANHHLPTLSCSPHVAVAALDGRPLGSGRVNHTTDDLTLRIDPSHYERIRFFIIASPQSPIILGYPWLNRHGPSIAWADRTISSWSPHCHSHCLRPRVTSTRARTCQGSSSGIPLEYQDLLEAFSRTKATRLPPHRPGDCAIDLLPGAVPPKGRIFPLSQAESEAMHKYIQEELAKGFITPSTSPASAGFFFVKKKDGGLRPCIDYRGLNEVTIKYRYPLPLVPSALEQLRSAKYFTKLDLRSAYNLVRIRAGDEWKTAFSTTSGHYEYRVMPFGLANSPSCFQAFINDVFRDMLNRWVIVYIDDILVFSNSYPEHVQHVRAVLQRLIAHQLYAKEEKCDFHRDRISFLGYIISPEGVAMDQKKVDAVLRWPRPSTLRELQRFLGFANFYRRFIRNFSTVAAPLTTMIKRGVSRLSWSQAAIQAFNDLRQRFSTAPILHHPDPERPFVLEVDASSTGVGAVLSQRQGEPPKLFPCAYFSHKLNPAERNYDVGNRELLAIKLALEEWRHWLEGARHPFTVLTDHRNLEYLRSAKTLNHRQARWALFFTRFQFQVTYRPGSQNTKADALSRLHESDQPPSPPEPVLSPAVIVAPVTWDLMTEIAEAQILDPSPLECPAGRTYVPLTLRSRVLAEVHTVPSSGHPGIEATIHLLNNRFWWPSLRLDTINFVKACTACNTAKVPRRLPAGLLQPLPVPQRPWSHIAVDFVTDLPVSNGHTTVLSVVDRFSKACRFIPLPKLPTALETAEILCNWVFRLYGLPEDIVSDRGPQFTSRLWANFFRQLGVNVSLTSGYHPQANGQVERLNQELIRFLRTYCQNRQEDWSRFLFWAEYAQNSLHKPSTNLTPFQCVLGYQPPMFPWSGEPSELPAVDSWLQNSEETWNQAHVHLRGLYDAPRRKPIAGAAPIHHTNLDSGSGFRPGICVFPAGDPEGAENLEGTASQGPTPIVVDGEEVYRVNTILDSRRRRGQLQYLVDWEGFGPEERSWVASGDILDPSLTTEFHTNHPDRPAPRGRGRPRRRVPPRARSRSQGGGGSVTTAVSVAPSNRRQREPSPDF